MIGLPLHTRRQLLAGSAAAVAAVMPGIPAAGKSGHATPDDLQKLDGNVVVLHDRRVPLSHEALQRIAGNGSRVIDLTDDPVRLWRGEHGRLLAQRDTRLLGVTRWPEFLLVSGLAAESRRHVRYQRHDADGTMTWLIC